MNIYLIKNEQYHGPYTKAEVMNRIGAGDSTWNDHAWCEGCTAPVPLMQIIGTPPESAENPPMNLPHIDCKKKVLTWLVVLWLFFGFVPTPSWMAPLATVWLVIVHGGIIVASWHLARLMRRSVPLWIALTALPFVNLIAAGRLISLAASILKQNRKDSSSNGDGKIAPHRPV